MGVDVLLGAGLVILVGLWFLVRRFEREARSQAETLVRDTERMLSAFEVRVVTEPVVVGRRRRDGRYRRRRRKQGGSDKSRGSQQG